MGSAHTDTKVKNNDEGHSQKLSKNISNGFYSENSWWRSLEFIAVLNSDTALFEISSKVFHHSFSKFFHHWIFLKMILELIGVKENMLNHRRDILTSVHKLYRGINGRKFCSHIVLLKNKSYSFLLLSWLASLSTMKPILYFWGYEFLDFEKLGSKGRTSNTSYKSFGQALTENPPCAPPPFPKFMRIFCTDYMKLMASTQWPSLSLSPFGTLRRTFVSGLTSIT